MPYAQKIYVYLIAFLFKKTGLLILSYHRQPGVISPCFAFPPGTSTLESAGVVVEFPTWISFRVFFSKKPTSRRGTPWFFNTRNNCQSQMEFSKDHGETNPNKWKNRRKMVPTLSDSTKRLQTVEILMLLLVLTDVTYIYPSVPGRFWVFLCFIKKVVKWETFHLLKKPWKRKHVTHLYWENTPNIQKVFFPHHIPISKFQTTTPSSTARASGAL